MNQDLLVDLLVTYISISICLSPVVILATIGYFLWRWRKRRLQRFSAATAGIGAEQAALKHYTLTETQATSTQVKLVAAADSARLTTLVKNENGARPAKLTRQQKAAIVRQARLDYEQARGYAHFQILEKARKQLQTQLQEIQESIKRDSQKVPKPEAQQQQELMQQLEYHLLHDRLDEVAGIGSALKYRILTTLNARRLRDLQRAYSVSGVGQNRQQEINQWVRHYSQRLPQMVNEPFPGRDMILRKYQSQTAEVQRSIELQRTRQAEVEQKLALIEPHYAWLHAINATTFEKAALGAGDDMSQLARYTVGLFAEWEPVPEWFKEIADVGAT